MAGNLFPFVNQERTVRTRTMEGDGSKSTQDERKEDSVSMLLRRQAEERIVMKKRHEKMRSSIPKKDRVGRQRAAEDAAEEEKRQMISHNAELKEHGISEEEVSQHLQCLSISSGENPPSETTGQSSAPRGESKAARRRRKKAQQDAEAERRVAEEKASMGPSAKSVELQSINSQLRPKKLRIHPIAADGHCLYGAVAHQINLAKLSSRFPRTVEGLRELTADYLRAHKSEFMPFIEAANGNDALFARYCDDLQNTATWGGQVELNVLAQVLNAVIEVYAADLPLVQMGSESGGDSVLRVSFHRQYLGLGDHYNSIVPQSVQ